MEGSEEFENSDSSENESKSESVDENESDSYESEKEQFEYMHNLIDDVKLNGKSGINWSDLGGKTLYYKGGLYLSHMNIDDEKFLHILEEISYIQQFGGFFRNLLRFDLRGNHITKSGLEISLHLYFDLLSHCALLFDDLTIYDIRDVLMRHDTNRTISIIHQYGHIVIYFTSKSGFLDKARTIDCCESYIKTENVDEKPDFKYDFIRHYEIRGGFQPADAMKVFISINLCSITLTESDIGDEDFTLYMGLLQKCKNLKNVDFSKNDITDASIPDICVFIKEHKYLKTFNLTYNQFTQEGNKRMKAALVESGSITNFDTSFFFENFNDVLCVIDNCEKLEYINRNKQMHSSVRYICGLLLFQYKQLCIAREVMCLIAKEIYSSRTDLSLWCPSALVKVAE